MSTENESKDSVAQPEGSPDQVEKYFPEINSTVTDVGFFARQINSAQIGVDDDGFLHHYWRKADAIVVYDESGVVRVEYLDGTLIEKWIKFVGQERGWESPGQCANALIKADKWRKE
ncbi:hypothetical protein [Haloarcula sp. Atlit-7R]|uniref:hypothetical protein n=1 Tax=Haloarcula sp. Atlit-7R TaxID=2282125 RepID=UPI000EF16666|nr:hypothetical protein [Haloarcula sp. Atlit-7R]RLM94380.1 hypothetical protein D3D01_16080 [Haloarcula sp. Atlit-7R]